MKNPASYLKKKLFAILNTAVTYNATVVPAFGNDQEHDDPLQIVIGEYSDADSSNKHNFAGNATQVIEVVSVQNDGSTKTVDEVGELVMNVIHPTVRSQLLSGTDFQVVIRGKPSVNHLIEPSGSGQKIVRLILRYNLLIIDNNV